MSGFLNNLLNRTLNRSGAVRPRIPVRFESLPANDSTISETADLTPAAPATESLPLGKPAATRHDRQHPGQPAPGSLQSSVPPSPSQVLQPPGEGDRLAPPAEGPRRRITPAQQPPGHSDQPSPAIIPTPAKQDFIVRSEGMTGDPGIRPPGWTDPTPISPASASPEPAPTIRVTIGRIEVRATAPKQSPASPAKAARSGPKFTLNDYLNKRRGAPR